MTPTPYLSASDLHGLARLAVDGVAGTSRLVEQLHGAIIRTAAPTILSKGQGTGGITGLVYRAVRGVNTMVGASIDTLASPIVARLPRRGPLLAREHWIAALNGVVGDHLAASDNPLAISMAFRQGGNALTLDRSALARSFDPPSQRLLIAVHGLCMNDLHWSGTTDASGRARDLPGRLGRAAGFTPLYLHYNSGRNIEDNGVEFSCLLEQLVENWPTPIEDIVLLGHSMGGLIARSALDQGQRAGHRWARSLSRMAYLGTPHHGAPLERLGHRFESLLDITPYSAPFTRLGRIRSAGITDLRHGGLPVFDGGVQQFAIAATARTRAGSLAGGLLGDELVPIDSALGRHPDPEYTLGIPEENCRIVAGASHWGLLHHPEVDSSLRRWLREEHGQC